MKLSKSLLRKYLLSYLMILIIPLTVLGGVLYQKVIYDLKKKINTTTLYQLNQMRESIDAQFDALDFTVNRIMTDSDLTLYMLTSSEVNTMQATRALRRYCNFAPTENLLMYFYGQKQLLTINGISSFRAARIAPNLKGWTETQLANAFTEKEASSIQYAFPASAYLLYFCPLTSSSGNEYGRLGFIIHKSALFTSASQMSYRQSSLFVLDGNMLIYQHNTLLLSDNQKEELFSQNNDISKLKEAGGSYVVFRCRSARLGWEYYYVVPASSIYQEFYQNRTLTYAIYLITVIAVLIMALGFSKWNYAPIKKLFEFASEKWCIPQSGGNELERITYAMESATQKVEELKHQLDLHTIEDGTEELVDWLYGRNKLSENEQRELLENAGMGTANTKYFVLLICLLEKPSFTRETILFFLRDVVSSPESKFCFTDMTPANQIAVIVGTNRNFISEQTLADYQQFLLHMLLNLLQDKLEKRVLVSAGGAVSGISEIPVSYLQALLALDYLDEQNGQNIVSYEHAVKNKKSDWWYPDDQLLLLSQALSQGEEENVRSVLNNLDCLIYERLYSGSSRKCVLFEVYNFLIKFSVKRNVPLYFDEIDLLVQFEDREHFRENTWQIAKKIFAESSLNRSREKERLFSDIFQYVDKNFENSNFSMDSVAIQFNISLSFLGKIFRDQTGITFSEYITQKRLNLCKHLLVCTDKPIKDIVSEIGYLDHSNFTRKFRSSEQMTPGEYRKRFTEKKNG